jgi:hypothetical protein
MIRYKNSLFNRLYQPSLIGRPIITASLKKSFQVRKPLIEMLRQINGSVSNRVYGRYSLLIFGHYKRPIGACPSVFMRRLKRNRKRARVC